MCDGTGVFLFPSPFFLCGTEALQEPFGSGGRLRGLSSQAGQLTPATSSPPNGLEDIIPVCDPTTQPCDDTVSAAGPDVGDFVGTTGKAEDDTAARDLTGLPSVPPALDVDLEDVKGEQAEAQEWQTNESLDLDRGPAQTPEPVAPQPPPFMPPAGTAPLSSVLEGQPKEAGFASPRGGVTSVIVVQHYFPQGLPVTVRQLPSTEGFEIPNETPPS